MIFILFYFLFSSSEVLPVKIKLSILKLHFFKYYFEEIVAVTKNVFTETFSKLHLICILAQQSVYCLPYVEDLRPSHIIC